MSLMVARVSGAELRGILWAAGATFLRVEFVLILAGLWTIPVGVYIGLRPRLAAIAQPIAQIAASVPATALFPIVLLALIRARRGTWHRVNRPAADGYAVVHPLQCHRRRIGHPDGP